MSSLKRTRLPRLVTFHPGRFERQHHVGMARGLGQRAVDGGRERVHQFRPFRAEQPQHGAAVLAEVALAGGAMGGFVAGVLEAGVVDAGALAPLDFQGLGVGGEVDGVTATALYFAADAAVAVLVRIRGCGAHLEVHGAATDMTLLGAAKDLTFRTGITRRDRGESSGFTGGLTRSGQKAFVPAPPVRRERNHGRPDTQPERHQHLPGRKGLWKPNTASAQGDRRRLETYCRNPQGRHAHPPWRPAAKSKAEGNGGQGPGAHQKRVELEVGRRKRPAARRSTRSPSRR